MNMQWQMACNKIGLNTGDIKSKVKLFYSAPES